MATVLGGESFPDFGSTVNLTTRLESWSPRAKTCQSRVDAEIARRFAAARNRAHGREGEIAEASLKTPAKENNEYGDRD